MHECQPVEIVLRDILRRRLGAFDFTSAIRTLTAICGKSIRGGTFAPFGKVTHTYDPDFMRLSDAVVTLTEVLPRMLTSAKGTLQEMERRGAGTHPSVGSYRDSVTTLAKLLTAARRVEPRCITEKRPKPDPRSAWHGTARAIRNAIARDIKNAGGSAPTANSAKSPLVVAVCDILKLVHCQQQPDAVRKVLVGKPARD